MQSLDLRENIKFSKECTSLDTEQLSIGLGEENSYHLWIQMSQNRYPRFCASRRYFEIHPNQAVVTQRRSHHVIEFKDDVRQWDDGKDEPMPKPILHWGTKWDRDSGFGGSGQSARDQANKVTFEIMKLDSDEVHVCRLDRTLTFADIWFDLLLMIRRISGHQVVKLLEKVEGTYRRVKVTEYLPQEIGMDRSFAIHVIEVSQGPSDQGLNSNPGPSYQGLDPSQGPSGQGPDSM